MYAERHDISLTTDGDGDVTAYSPHVTGRVLAVIYTKTDFANTADITVTAEATGEPIVTLTDITASAVRYPRVGVHDATGAAATLDGTRLYRDCVTLVRDRVKVVVAQGGATKIGTITVVIG